MNPGCTLELEKLRNHFFSSSAWMETRVTSEKIAKIKNSKKAKKSKKSKKSIFHFQAHLIGRKMVAITFYMSFGLLLININLYQIRISHLNGEI